PPPVPQPSGDGPSRNGRDVEGKVRALLASALQVSEDRLAGGLGWEEFGVDSILIVKLTTVLEGEFGPLPKTLLFEHRNLDALVEFLSVQKPTPEPKSKSETEALPMPERRSDPVPDREPAAFRAAMAEDGRQAGVEPIAVV